MFCPNFLYSKEPRPPQPDNPSLKNVRLWQNMHYTELAIWKTMAIF